MKEVIHPTNRVWPGDPDHPMPTLPEAYQSGFERGKTWPKDKLGWQHHPGGPFVHTYDKRFIALCDHNQKVLENWMNGWYDGFMEVNKDDLPSWFKVKR